MSAALDIRSCSANAWKQYSQIAPRPSPALSDCTRSTTPGPTLEEEIAAIYRTYNRLKKMGGRPSAPINPDPGPCDPSKSAIDKEYHISDHWHGERNRVGEEMRRWVEFRKHQERVRGDQESFEKYIEDVSKHIRDAGIKWTVQLQRKPEQQRKFRVDNWKEYYIYEHRKRRGLEKNLERVLQLPESNLDRKSERWLYWNNRLMRAKTSLEQLDNLLKWIDGQFPEIAAECWWGRLRSRKETAMIEAICRDRLRHSRGAVVVPLERPNAMISPGKPMGIVKRSSGKVLNKRRLPATKDHATKSSRQEADRLSLSSTQSDESYLQAIPASVTQAKKKYNTRRQSSCQASTAETSPQSISARVKRRQPPHQAITAQPQGVQKDRKRRHPRGLKGAALTTKHKLLHLLTPPQSD